MFVLQGVSLLLNCIKEQGNGDVIEGSQPCGGVLVRDCKGS